MPTNRPIPEISVGDFAARLQSSDRFVILDVREQWEFDLVRLVDPRLHLAPMTQLAKQGLKGLPAPAQDHGAELYVLCHHGSRSAQVTAWLVSGGWTNVYSVSGGMDEYAHGV